MAFRNVGYLYNITPAGNLLALNKDDQFATDNQLLGNQLLSEMRSTPVSCVCVCCGAIRLTSASCRMVNSNEMHMKPSS